MMKSVRVIAAAMVVFALGGCGAGGGSTPALSGGVSARPVPVASPGPTASEVQSTEYVFVRSAVHSTGTQSASQISVSDGSACTSGTVNVTGGITGSIATTLSFGIIATPVNCADGGWVINGNPSISINGTASLSGGQIAFSGSGPSGGWTMSGNGQTVSCVITNVPTWSTLGNHGMLTASSVMCNGVPIAVPPYSW